MKLYLNFHEFAKTGSGTWVDYSEALLNDRFVRKSCFGALGKAEMQTVTMLLKPVVGLTALAVNILTATNDIRAKLTLDDNTPYFIGTIRPLVSGEVREVIKPISVEILDDTHFLEAYIFAADATLSSSLMAVSATPANSLVHWLISHAKVKDSVGGYVPAFATSDIVIDAGVDIAVPADGLTVEVGDYVNAILDTVCYEYNLQYRCSEDGKLHITPSIPATTITGARTLTNADIKNYTNPKRGDDARKGAVVTYYPVVKGACVVGRHETMDSRYADDKTYGRGYEWLNTDEPGGQWPPYAYQNVTLSTYDLDKSKRKILRYDFTTLRTKISFHDGSKSTSQSMGHAANNGDGTARVYIQVGTNKTLIERMDCLCDCWYIDEEDEQTTQVHQGQNPEKYEAKYLHSGVTAGALLRAIVLRSTTGNLTHSFQTGQDLSLTPGEVVFFAPSALGFTGYVRIVSVTDHGGDKNQPLVDVVAESVTALSDIDVDTSEQVRSVLQKGGVTILHLVTESTVVKYSGTGTVTVRAEGDAISVLGGTVNWTLNGLSAGSGVSVSIGHDSFMLGLNTVRAVVAIAGVDFEDKPLDAELYITMVEDVPVRQVLVQTLTPIIHVSARGTLRTATIDITAVLTGLSIADAVWTCSDGTLSAGVDAYHKVLACSTVMGESTVVTVTVTSEGVTYTGTLGIQKVVDGPVVVENMHGVTEVPSKTVDNEPLVAGDYFMWADSNAPAGSTIDPVIAYPTLTKGEIYEYNGTAWVKSANGNLVMTMFDDFADLANDVESTVIGNAVIKKLVAIDAFIENLKVQMLEVINGTYSAKINATDGLKIAKDGVTLLNAPPSGGIEILGTLKAGSLIPFSNIRNGLGQDGNNNNFSTFTYTTTPGYFPEGTNGSFSVSGSEYVNYFNDDFIPVDTTKAYTLEMWAMATEGISTTEHYLYYDCYDANKNHIEDTYGGTYNYLVSGNLSSDWTKYSSTINGIDGGASPTKFRPGTAFIKVGCLFNYSHDAYHELYIAGITLREATPFSVDGTAFQTANGKVKIHNDGTIEAVDGVFSGDMTAYTGFFGGQMNCPSFSSLPATGPSTKSVTTGTTLYAQYSDITRELGSYISGYTVCTHSLNAAIKYVRYEPHTIYDTYSFYNESFQLIGYVRTGNYNDDYDFSTWSGQSFTLTVWYGAGDVFKFKNIPVSSNGAGLASGQVYRDSANGNVLKMVP